MSLIDGIFAGFNFWAVGYVMGAMLLLNIVAIQIPIFVCWVAVKIVKWNSERKYK